MVYIGVGGTGLDIGRSLEQMLRDEITGPDGRRLIARGGSFGGFRPRQLPGFLQTLYLDFSEQELVTLQNELVPGAGDVAAKTATFIKSLSSAGHASSDVTNLLRSSTTAAPIVADWLPPKLSDWGNEPTFAPLATGAGQYPTIGRAALFAYMERFGAEALMRDLRRPLESINSSMGQLEEYTGNANPSRTVYFMVGGSLSGGTGGGLFTDIIRLVAHAAQEKLGTTPFVIVPLVLLPSAFDKALAPGKRKNATLNTIRGLADLGALIDDQNAPSQAGEKTTLQYPDGGSGKGALTTILPDASVKAAFVFHRPVDVPSAKALAERTARFAVNLLRQPSAVKNESTAGSTGRTMILMDKLVNNSALLYEPHPTFLGRRPFASSACVAISDGRESYVHYVTKQIVAAVLEEEISKRSPDELANRVRGLDLELKIAPPDIAPLHPQRRSDIVNVAEVSVEAVNDVLIPYFNELNKVSTQDGKGINNIVRDELSAGASSAFKDAANVISSNTGWISFLKGAGERQKKNIFWLLGVANEATKKWATGGLAGSPRQPVEAPTAQNLVDITKGGLFGRKKEAVISEKGLIALKAHEAGRVDATWRNYLSNTQGPAQHFKDAAVGFQQRLRRTEEALTGQNGWLTDQSEKKQKDAEASLQQRLGVARDLRELTDRVVRELGRMWVIGEPSRAMIGHEVLMKCQDQALERWKEIDHGAPEMLIVRLLEAAEPFVSQAFDQPEVYPELGHILGEWASPDSKEMSSEVRSFQSRFLASISDAFIPPSMDRDIEPMISVAYPGESNINVENKLKEALSSHPSLERFLRQSEPTFLPRSASNAIVISVCLVGQGLIDIEGGATGLNMWIEAAFRPEPTDRLAWRQRVGYRDPIAFIEGDLKIELVQRLLAAAWNGELAAKRIDVPEGEAGSFESLQLHFAQDGSTVLTVPLGKMPFSNFLAPLPDAWLREITRRYTADTISVSEVLRELARCIPIGFVERQLPPNTHFEVPIEIPAKENEIRNGHLFLEFDEALNPYGAGHTERKLFAKLNADLKKDGKETEKRRHQIHEYWLFWGDIVPRALKRSFGTLGYGSLREAVDELADRENKRAKK
jgi:hypothetical protein